MKDVLSLFLLILPLLSIAQYAPEIDAIGQNDVTDGGELQLATPSLDHFLRLFSGRDGDPNPFLYFSNTDTFSIASGNNAFENFNNLLKIYPNGDFRTKWLTTFYHYDMTFGENYRRLPYLRKGWNGKYWDFMYLGATGGRDNDAQSTMMFSNRQGFQFGRGHNEGDTLTRVDMTVDTGGVVSIRNLEGNLDALVLVDSSGQLKRAAYATGPSGSGFVTDIDGNQYLTVQIGTQTWMRENLRVTNYRNGDPIPEILLNADWAADSLGGWCWYDHDSEKDKPYGKLYNWYTVDDPRGICPMGWHVPTDDEWTALTTILGGGSVAGGKMKTTDTIEACTGYWIGPNTGASNESGFTGIPGGSRFPAGTFPNYLGSFGLFWSSDPDAWYRTLAHNSNSLNPGATDKKAGLSVRCVKD